MTFLTILEGMEILFSFRLVLEGKAGKEIPEASRLELLEKYLANNFVLSDAEENIPRLLYRGVKADLPLAVCQKSRKPKVWEVIDFHCFSSICKFGSFQNLFATVTSLTESLTQKIYSVVTKKKVISMNYDSSTSC